MKLHGVCVTAIAALLVMSSAQAQTAASSASGVLTYNASFFADARPNTAYDMIQRVPGFTFDDGDSKRGFAGTAGNVLIDGQRPTSKSDDLQSILQRVPASDVDHIEVIRGGESGMDMHGHTVIANVVRKTADSTKIVAQVANNFWLIDHHSVPSASLEFTKHTGKSIFEASIKRFANYDDSVGRGHITKTDIATGKVTEGGVHSAGRGAGTSLTAAATVPLFSGLFKANLSLQESPFHSVVAYYYPTGTQRIPDDSSDRTGELGLHWNGDIGATHLETLVLQRLEHNTDVNGSFQPGLDQLFKSRNNTGETIARATLRYNPLQSLTLEGGAEGAFNFLDGKSSYLENGVIIPLPSGNARVTEKRGEVFAKGTWKFAPDWILETGARFEFSKISETGLTAQSRSFFYPKPRAVLTWNINPKNQIRLRYERVVGQLDFGNFIATSNLGGTGLSAGNPDLKPDQRDQFEASYEWHFWDKGAIVASYLHEQIKDVSDQIPIYTKTGAFDAPGNIGNGRNDEIHLEMTLPLDRLGLTNGLLKTTNVFRFSHVTDPVTGHSRGISFQRPREIQVTLTQDIDSLKSTWGVTYVNGWKERSYLLTQTRIRSVNPPYLEAWWEYKPTPEWSLRFEVDNIGRFVYASKYERYSGPRNTSPLSQTEYRTIKSQPRIYVQIRKTFG
ncbi:MAG TPA: TonB-dependent receptor [Rhizomicrobium sp.]|nr:TonB-dependent receptor [Rhizomicrobium sp.]